MLFLPDNLKNIVIYFNFNSFKRTVMPQKRYLLLFFLALAIVAGGCKKKKKDDVTPYPPPGQEADLVATIPSINLNQDNNAAQGATLSLKLSITSTPLPSRGVSITVTATDPSGAVIAQNAAVTGTTASTDFTLINLPSLKVAKIVVTVTSNSKATNTLTFRFGVLNKTP